jgi:hypothetical protein
MLEIGIKVINNPKYLIIYLIPLLSFIKKNINPIKIVILNFQEFHESH